MTAVRLFVAILAFALMPLNGLAQDNAERLSGNTPHKANRSPSIQSRAQLSTPEPRSRAQDNQNPFDVMKPSAERGPIRIRSDTLDVDYKARQVFYRGHVHVTQADAVLDSDTLQVIYGANFNDIQQVIAIGNVHMTRGTDVVTGKRAVLDEIKQTVTVTGDPVIRNGRDRVAGDRILVYLENQRSVIENAHAVLYPRQPQTANGKKADTDDKKKTDVEDKKDPDNQR
jgi:lipopolysaccharide export system protein LptA